MKTSPAVPTDQLNGILGNAPLNYPTAFRRCFTIGSRARERASVRARPRHEKATLTADECTMAPVMSVRLASKGKPLIILLSGGWSIAPHRQER